MKPKRPKIALVLGGGGARGLAHIGVLKALEENKIPIDIIAGTSIGAFIGGLYASGISIDKIKAAALSVDRKFVMKMLAPGLPTSGFVDGDRIRGYLKTFFNESCIEQLLIRFAAVATDLKTGKEVVIKRGPIIEAIMASIAIPVLFKPVLYRNKYLCDGGLVNPLPINVAYKLGADIVIAINVEQIPMIRGEKSQNRDSNGIFRLNKTISMMRARFQRNSQETGVHLEPIHVANEVLVSTSRNSSHPIHLSILRILIQSISIMECNLISYRLKENSPDILISVPTGKYELLEFHRAKEIIKLGKKAALNALPLIKTTISEELADIS